MTAVHEGAPEQKQTWKRHYWGGERRTTLAPTLFDVLTAFAKFSLVIEGEEVSIWASEHETKMYALFKVLLLKTEKVSRVRTTLVEQIYNRSTSISGRECQFGATGY